MQNGETRTFKENISDQLRRSRQTLDEMRAEARAKARRAVRNTNNYAHDHPWNLAAGAAAVAFIAGYLMRPSGRKKIVVKSADGRKPVVKIAKMKSKGRTGLEALSALAPVLMMGLKMYQSRQARTAPASAEPVNAAPVI